MLGRNERENLFKKLGMGGYYFIIEVDHEIESGLFKTNIVARWNAFGDGTINGGEKIVGTNIVERNFVLSTEKAEITIGE